MLRSPLKGMSGQSGGGGGGPLFIPGAQFDGVNDFMVNNSFLIPSSNSYLMIRFSMYLEGSAGQYYVILSDAAGYVTVYVHPDGNLQFIVSGVSGNVAVRSASPVPVGVWQTVLIAVDTNHASANKKVHLYINDVNSIGIVEDQYPAFNIAHSSSKAIGSLQNEGLKFFGALAGIWVGCGQYLDLSIEANRRKFADAAGRPVKELGADGSTPTGTTPDIYLKQNYLSFGLNEGTAGNFVVYGALTEPVEALPAS